MIQRHRQRQRLPYLGTIYSVLPDIQMMAELIHESDIASGNELRRRNVQNS